MDDIRHKILMKQEAGYELCAKGFELEAQFLAGRPLGMKIRNMIHKTGYFVYDPAIGPCSDYPYPATLFNVHMGTYKNLYRFYYDYVTHRENEIREKERQQNGMGRSRHLPMSECQIFLLHWKASLEYLLFEVHWSIWKNYYERKAFGARLPLMKRLVLQYWDERMQWLPSEGHMDITLKDPWVLKCAKRLYTERAALEESKSPRAISKMNVPPSWWSARQALEALPKKKMYLQGGVLTHRELLEFVPSWYLLFIQLTSQKLREHVKQHCIKECFENWTTVQSCYFLGKLSGGMTHEDCWKLITEVDSRAITREDLEMNRRTKRKNDRWPYLAFRPVEMEEAQDLTLPEGQYWYINKFDIILCSPREVNLMFT